MGGQSQESRTTLSPSVHPKHHKNSSRQNYERHKDCACIKHTERLLAGLSLGALAEAVLEAARQVAHESHAAGTLSAAALGLVVVVEAAHLGGVAEPAGRAGRLLHIVRGLSAATADDVRLVIARARAADTFGHGC